MKKITFIGLLFISSSMLGSVETIQTQIPITPEVRALQKALQREREGSLNIKYNPGAAYNKEIPHHIRGFLFNALKIQKALDLHQNTPLSDEYRQYLEATFTYNQHIAYQQHRTDALLLQARVGAELVTAIESACENSTTAMHAGQQDQQQSYELSEPAHNSLTQETTISPDSMKRPDCKTNTKTSNAPKKVFNGNLICLHRNKKLTRQQTEALRQKAALQSANDRARYKLYKEKNKEIQEQLEKAEKLRRQEQSRKDKDRQFILQQEKSEQEKKEREEILFLENIAQETQQTREVQLKKAEEKPEQATKNDKNIDMLERIRYLQIQDQVNQARIKLAARQTKIDNIFIKYLHKIRPEALLSKLSAVIDNIAKEEQFDHPALHKIMRDGIIPSAFERGEQYHQFVQKLRSENDQIMMPDYAEREKYIQEEYEASKIEMSRLHQEKKWPVTQPVLSFITKMYRLVLSSSIHHYRIDEELTSQEQSQIDR